MKYICLISHEQPGDEPGRFTRYEAGTAYDLEGKPDDAYFAVYGGTEGDMEQGDRVAVNQDADAVGKGRKK